MNKNPIYPKLLPNTTVSSKKTKKQYKVSLWYKGEDREYELAPLEGGEILKFTEEEIATMITNGQITI